MNRELAQGSLRSLERTLSKFAILVVPGSRVRLYDLYKHELYG